MGDPKRTDSQQAKPRKIGLFALSAEITTAWFSIPTAGLYATEHTIMKLTLPPKRYEDPFDPRFDPIRHLPWFRKLEKRREKIPSLKQALAAIHDPSKPMSQKDASEAFFVDERELRDYEDFINGISKSVDVKFQKVLDDAYWEYCAGGGAHNLTWCIDRMSKLYGVNPRHVNEKFETDVTFLPS